MNRRRLASVLPLAVLFAIVSAAVAVRGRRSGGAPGNERGTPGVTARTEPSAKAQGLGAPRPAPAVPPLPAAAEAHAPRMIHGDARHTHRAKGKIPRDVKLAWTYETDGPIEAQVTASPDAKTLYVASLGGSLTALDANGTKRWSVALGSRVYGTPCVADDGATLYVGADGGLFYALASDGRILWKLETGGDADTGAALARDGSLVFAAGSTVFDVRPGGDVAWRFVAKGKVFTAPALTEDDLVIVGSQDHRAYALTMKGAEAWSVDLGADVDGAAAIGDDGAIFVGTDAGEVVRLGHGGEIVWRAPVGGFVRGTLSMARNGDVLAGVYGPVAHEARLQADGSVRGELAIQGTGAREFGVHGGALEDDDGALVFGGQDDAVVAVNADGALMWRFATRDDVDAPITLLPDGTVVVGSDDGRVYALVAR